MIVHTVYTMTIRQYARFKREKNIKLLFRYPVPMWYAIKHAEKFIKQFNDIFSGVKTDTEKELSKLKRWTKIVLLQAIIAGIQMHLNQRMQVIVLKSKGVPVMEPDKILDLYIEEAKQCTGIEVQNLDDIKTLKDELERMIAKYNELYPVAEVVETEGVSIMQLAFGIESLLNCKFDYDKTTLWELSEAKKLADERAKEMQKTANKYE